MTDRERARALEAALRKQIAKVRKRVPHAPPVRIGRPFEPTGDSLGNFCENVRGRSGFVWSVRREMSEADLIELAAGLLAVHEMAHVLDYIPGHGWRDPLHGPHWGLRVSEVERVLIKERD